MSAFDLLLLTAAGFVSGALNAVAGGGTFFSFGALLAVGLPPITANATSAVAMVPGYVASALAYRKELGGIWASALWFSVAGVAGSVLGAIILIALDNETFADFVPWLLLGATLVFAAGPAISSRLPARPHRDRGHRIVAIAVQFVISIYGGFFGAGMGFLLLASLGYHRGQNFHRINAMKLILSIVIQTAAIVVFVQGDVISWPEALVLVVAVIAGGWLGVDAARRLPVYLLRGFVIFTGTGLRRLLFHIVLSARPQEVRPPLSGQPFGLLSPPFGDLARDGRN